MALNLFDLLPPERVREIAELWMEEWYDKGPVNCAENAINAAAPEIARAVLEMAARRLDAKNDTYCAKQLRQMAKEITNAD